MNALTEDNKKTTRKPTGGVKGDVEDLVVVAAQCVHARAARHVPHLRTQKKSSGLFRYGNQQKQDCNQFQDWSIWGHPYLASAVNGAGDAQVGGIVELAAGDLALVPRQRVDATARAHVPDLHRVVEAARDDAVALRVEVQRDDLGRVSQQRVCALAGFDIPQTRGVVHRARG